MDLEELQAQLAEDGPYGDYYETLVWVGDSVAFVCNQCATELPTGESCPTHGPRDVPGLRLADCEATPPHRTWVVDGDHCGYGVSCFRCLYDEQVAALAVAEKRDRCYHWPWRRWAVTRWICAQLYVSGLAGHGGGVVWGGGPLSCHRCQYALPGGWLRRNRPYILWISRDRWRCWLTGRHRRGEEVGFGRCGKCVPWPCCGSIHADHDADCPENFEVGEYAAGTPIAYTVTVTTGDGDR